MICNAPNNTEEINTPVIGQNISEHIQRKMDDIISILDNRVQ